jgi:hypothetical protein
MHYGQMLEQFYAPLVIVREGIYSTVEYLVSVPSAELAPPTPFPISECVSPPHLDSRWVDTLACGGGGWGSQFRRPARNSGTRYILCGVPLKMLKENLPAIQFIFTVRLIPL